MLVGAGVVFDDEEFFSLQRKWYEKLKKKGFIDIEKTQKNKAFLTQYHSHYFFRHHQPEEIESTQAYYRMCYEFYWHYHGFKTKREKMIWWLHSEGHSNREIIEQTKQTYYKIQNMIAQFKKIMQSGTWQSSEGAEGDR